MLWQTARTDMQHGHLALPSQVALQLTRKGRGLEKHDLSLETTHARQNPRTAQIECTNPLPNSETLYMSMLSTLTNQHAALLEQD